MQAVVGLTASPCIDELRAMRGRADCRDPAKTPHDLHATSSPLHASTIRECGAYTFGSCGEVAVVSEQLLLFFVPAAARRIAIDASSRGLAMVTAPPAGRRAQAP